MPQFNVHDFVLVIYGVDNMGDVLKVKRLPGWEYNELHNVWVVPVRPGLADAIEKIFGVTLAEPVRVREKYFMTLIAPPPPGSVNMEEVSAADAVELACLWHLYDFHKGDLQEYNRIHSYAVSIPRRKGK